ncbi:Putative monooxygenase [Mycobacteroides abscessus subsp. abscessus]|uniref:2-heptyl-3-hydroxy-4(1H)-quinolone synthase n=38 Tax=Mycobacteroides abscessus TaxID=36809 RepID=AQDB_MYCA9|nr:NAD(P)/FAD-dependent oxidoreductase [Mycobacteroides abscessus]B1MFK1.1 RecName: Full=2-heptyl-3-hydroxy-4(1H)-quinolone synthase; Short=PQS synthase; AltName: Full=2-heptyl-4(1H)-quinolone monooxygenase; Short=HHQ monooxygenase [Mycobacteroides abscessus ATCC 19977]ETZ87415.1 FAD binding domain protein [Mycobacteroides abscessus MAB_030201_1075]ETZ95035.1 FAD binding domain protein [Mycobacteroides abscessus MAB_030201_1061]EUA46237.1 FAD binding domain protein [Mycobacteroides abscessus 21
MSSGHAEVVGGGIGGLTAATALALRGWTVRLHERDTRIRTVGAGIYVWDNGLEALDTIGAAAEGLDDAYEAPAITVRASDGRPLYRIDVNQPGGARCVTLLRDRLIGALHVAAEHAGVEVCTGSAAVSATADGTVEFSTGTSTRADLVVAADGVHSLLRDRLGISYRRIRMRQGAARVMVSGERPFIPGMDVDQHHEFLGGRRRLLYTPCTATQTYLAFVADNDDTATVGPELDLAAWARAFPLLVPVFDAARGRALIRWDNFELIRLSTWSHGRVAVLGDAAHAQPPYVGQGGGTAMNSAVGLAAAVSESADVEDGLNRWEQALRPPIEKAQTTSYRMRLIGSVPEVLRGPLLGALGRSRSSATSQLIKKRSAA